MARADSICVLPTLSMPGAENLADVGALEKREDENARDEPVLVADPERAAESVPEQQISTSSGVAADDLDQDLREIAQRKNKRTLAQREDKSAQRAQHQRRAGHAQRHQPAFEKHLPGNSRPPPNRGAG